MNMVLDTCRGPPPHSVCPEGRPTHRETVLLGTKLGCSVSIRSTSSHTTLTRTCCLLSSLERSAVQWQLSTIRSGQFLLLRLEPHSPATTHSKLSALMLADGDSLLNTRSRPPSSWGSPGPSHIALPLTCCPPDRCELSAPLVRLNPGVKLKLDLAAASRCISAILCSYEVLRSPLCSGANFQRRALLSKSGENVKLRRVAVPRSCGNRSQSRGGKFFLMVRGNIPSWCAPCCHSLSSLLALLTTLDLLRMLVSRKSLPAGS